MQEPPGKRMLDGRLVSANWGGGRKRQGEQLTAEDRKGKRQATKARRTADKDAVRTRFMEHRSKLEALGSWAAPRKFEEWLLWLALREMGDGDAAEIPQVRLLVLMWGLSLVPAERVGDGLQDAGASCAGPRQR